MFAVCAKVEKPIRRQRGSHEHNAAQENPPQQRACGPITVGALALVSALAVDAFAGVASAAAPQVPLANRRADVTGTPTVGQTLTAQNGTWTNSPTAFQYQWRRCNATGASCVIIAGATERTYTLSGTDAGYTIRVIVTAFNADGAASATSAPIRR